MVTSLEIELPDGTILEAPDDADIKRVVQGYNSRNAKTPAQTSSRQAFEQSRNARLLAEAPLRQSIGSMDTFSDVGMNLLTSMVAAPVSGYAGMFGGSDAVENVRNAMTYQPRTVQGKAATQAISWPFEQLARGADYVGGNVAETSGSPALGAGINTAIQSIPAIVGGRGAISSSRGLRTAEGKAPSTAHAAQPKAGLGGVPPTIEELAAQSKAAYRRASDANANIAPDSFKGLKGSISDNLKGEGIDPTLHPQTTAALKRINDTKGAVTLDQLETLRKIASDARGGINKADSRLAGKIVDDLDDYMEGVGQKDLTTGTPEGFAALKEARNLYSRKMKAEEISELVRRAEISAPNFSASGMENALRTEFRALAKNAKKMRRFTAEERAAITKVAKGGKTENALRMLGKFAPQGALSTAISGGLGFAAGGPLGAVGLPAVGAASRYAATRMTRTNARLAEETMRRGPKQKQKTVIEEAETAAGELVIAKRRRDATGKFLPID